MKRYHLILCIYVLNGFVYCNYKITFLHSIILIFFSVHTWCFWASVSFILVASLQLPVLCWKFLSLFTLPPFVLFLPLLIVPPICPICLHTVVFFSLLVFHTLLCSSNISPKYPHRDLSFYLLPASGAVSLINIYFFFDGGGGGGIVYYHGLIIKFVSRPSPASSSCKLLVVCI